MSKKARLISIISVIFVAGAGLYLVGCDADNTGPTDPGVTYLPQTFSLAVADGSASNDGFDHNGVAVITLDWNNASPEANVVAPAYVYEYADQPYPRVDGALIGDATTWAQAPETVLTLNNVYGNGGIATIRIKSVYTFVNPPRIWFLLQWDDNATGQENPGYLGNHWEVIQKSGGASDWWEPLWNDNEDWVAFMWDTWRKVDEGPRDFYFASTTNGFQNNGCTVTCHSDDPNHPHHTNDADEVCDLWIWTGTRTNYTANLSNWASGANDPAFMFDCYIDRTGFGWGTNDSFPRDALGNYVEWLVFDEGGAPYFANEGLGPGDPPEPRGYPNYGAASDPNINARYLWLSDEGVREIGVTGDPPPISPTDERWNVGDRVPGYVHRAALGSAADVLGRGAWEDGEWTLEVRRNIGSTYGEINNDEDVFLGIFEAHPDE
jgi:hypothetical protein